MFKKYYKKIPKEEIRVDLTTFRASLSFLNIVEGCGRYTDKDFAHFLDNALGSVNEQIIAVMQHQIYIIHNNGRI